jgi:hypothetical protein
MTTPETGVREEQRHAVPESMRAAVLFGPQDIRVVDKPVPRPGFGEVLAKVAMCGTCGTDLKIYDGHFPQTPPYGEFTPGHEWTGTVVALGESVDEFYARLEADARKTVKAQLVIDAVGQAAGIEVEQDDLGMEIGRQAQRLGKDPQELAEFMTQPERIGALFSDAFRRKAIDHLLDEVQVLGGPPEDEPAAEAEADETLEES